MLDPVLSRRRVSRCREAQAATSSNTLLWKLWRNKYYKIQSTDTSLHSLFKMVERPGLKKRPSSNDRGVSPPPSKRKQQSTTTSTYNADSDGNTFADPRLGKAVANFFTPLSKKEPEKMSWRIVNNSLLVGRYAASTAYSVAKGQTKIAAFDFVSTHTDLVLHHHRLTFDTVGLNINHVRIGEGLQS